MKLIFESRQVQHEPRKIKKLKANGWRIFRLPKAARTAFSLGTRYRAHLDAEKAWFKNVPSVADGMREIERLLKIDVTVDTDAVGAFVHVFYWKVKGCQHMATGWSCVQQLYPHAKATPRETARALEDVYLEEGFVSQNCPRKRRRDGPLFGSRGD